MLLELLISSELSFLTMFPPLCCVNSPFFFGCLLPKSGRKATAFHNLSKLSQVCKGKLFIQECLPAGSKEQELICLWEGKRAVRYREDIALVRS